MLSWETNGDGDEHVRLWRAFAVYEKQLFTEKMVTACFMDHNKIRDWDENIKAPVLNRQEFVDIWEDKSGADVSMRVNASTWFDAEKRQSILSGAQAPRFGKTLTSHRSCPSPTTTRDSIGSKSTLMRPPNTDTHPARCISAMDVAKCRAPRHSFNPFSKLVRTVFLRYASGAHTLLRSTFRAT